MVWCVGNWGDWVKLKTAGAGMKMAHLANILSTCTILIALNCRF
jgi:hypothetical protein